MRCWSFATYPPSARTPTRPYSHTPTIVLILLLLAGCGVEPPKDFEGRVVGVMDGDTIEVLANWRVNRVRLYGVDCPESKQPYGRRAKQFTSSASYFRWAKVHTVTVDRYGRRVGTVTLPDNKVLNHELVRAGYAWWYRQYAPDDSTLEAVEKDARAAKRGLWSQKNPTPPWEWRERRR